MDKYRLKRIKVLYELLDYIDDLKENDDEINKFTNDINLFMPPRDSFEKQNDKVFNINLYILIRLYKKEYNNFIKERKKFNKEDYFDFVETLNIDDTIKEEYLKMPKIVGENKILSYITDSPSFMSMIN